VTETSITYAGTPVRLKSSKYDQAILIHNAAVLGDMSHRIKDIGIHVEKLQVSADAYSYASLFRNHSM
jgi:hypothetical protein